MTDQDAINRDSQCRFHAPLMEELGDNSLSIASMRATLESIQNTQSIMREENLDNFRGLFESVNRHSVSITVMETKLSTNSEEVKSAIERIANVCTKLDGFVDFKKLVKWGVTTALIGLLILMLLHAVDFLKLVKFL